MTATSKPKAERAIVRTVIDTKGVHSVVAQWASDRLDGAREVASALRHVPDYAAEALAAFDAIDALLKKANGQA